MTHGSTDSDSKAAVEAAALSRMECSDELGREFLVRIEPDGRGDDEPNGVGRGRLVVRALPGSADEWWTDLGRAVGGEYRRERLDEHGQVRQREQNQRLRHLGTPQYVPSAGRANAGPQPRMALTDRSGCRTSNGTGWSCRARYPPGRPNRRPELYKMMYKPRRASQPSSSAEGPSVVLNQLRDGL